MLDFRVIMGIVSLSNGVHIEFIMKTIYYLGRCLQAAGLAAMPFSIWVGHLGHDERGAIAIFVSSGIIFCLGWFLTARKV